MIHFSRLPGISAEGLGQLAGFFGIGVATIDETGRGLALNEQWCEWIGKGATPKTQDWVTAFDPDTRASVEAAVEEARAEGSASLEAPFLRGDGAPMWTLVRVFRMASTSGQLEGFVVGVSDISQLHQMTAKFERAALSTIESLSKMEAVRDLYTAGHQSRVGRLAEAIGVQLGLPEIRLTGLRIAAMLHDVGKVGTPIEILTKPARLTVGEFEVMKEHATNGYAILRNVTAEWPVARVAHEHHERMDGSGYPQGLRGDAILLEARITTVADVVESMAVNRPYRSGLGTDMALNEIQKNRGIRYDPDAVAACVKIVQGGFELNPAAEVH